MEFWTDRVFDLLTVLDGEEPQLYEAIEMYHKDDRSTVQNAIDSSQPFDVEVRVRTHDGDTRWFRLQGVPETVDDVVSLRGAAQDITEHKEREQRLEELIDRLEESNERLGIEKVYTAELATKALCRLRDNEFRFVDVAATVSTR